MSEAHPNSEIDSLTLSALRIDADDSGDPSDVIEVTGDNNVIGPRKAGWYPHPLENPRIGEE